MPDEDCWEARMAARARARAETARQVKRARVESDLAAQRTELDAKIRELGKDPDSYLHGWPRLPGDLAVLIGTSVHCVGCGRLYGVTCVAFPEGWEPPGPEPDWPFSQSDCPVCALLALGWQS